MYEFSAHATFCGDATSATKITQLYLNSQNAIN